MGGLKFPHVDLGCGNTVQPITSINPHESAAAHRRWGVFAPFTEFQQQARHGYDTGHMSLPARS